MTRLVSWNVNGLRAVSKKGFFDWLQKDRADIVCLQETKISADQFTKDLLEPKGYKSYFNCAQRRGYSGVLIYTRQEPKSISYGLGLEKFDVEGRVIQAEFDQFTLLNIYYPNGKAREERLRYKMDFYDAFLKYAQKLRKSGQKLIICGDFNTAHKEIDLARPKENVNESGFLPEERAWMDKFVAKGYIDTFRHFSNLPEKYTWWHMRTRARERNVGWRIDYFFASQDLEKKLHNADIHDQIQGSDHCPVSLSLKV